MFTNLKIYGIIGIGVFLVLGTILGMFYWYYTNSQSKIAMLMENNARLETAVKINEDTIKQKEKDASLQKDTLIRLNDTLVNINSDNQRLNTILSKHNLGYLAEKKPNLVESIINKSTKDAQRCIEIASGSPLTERERNATKPSEINSECPFIANPKYKGN